MRVSPPESLRMSADDLLRDVRDRLAETHPELEARLDATHPAWLVLQESAWMVEQLSGQLDRYPWAVVQQLAHLLGAQLRPAQPAIGVVTLETGSHGVLEDARRWRLFAPRTETRGLVEFALAEEDIPVAAGSFVAAHRVVDGALRTGTEVEGGRASFADTGASEVFSAETFTWTVLASAAEKVETLLTEAAARLRTERSLGWMRFEVSTQGDRVQLRGTLDVGAAFEIPSTLGGDVTAVWGTADDSTWTPEVTIGAHPLLPRSLRGSRPLSGGPGALLVPDVPAGIETASLLVRDARPAPASLGDAIWKTLVHLESRLGPMRPSFERGVEASEPAWVDAVMRSRAWSRIVDRAAVSIVSLKLEPGARSVRIGWVDGARTRAFGTFSRGVEGTELPAEKVWTERLPDAQGRLQEVTVAVIEVPEDAEGLLLVSDGEPSEALLNPALVVNAPIVRDGRRVTVARAIPEPVHLLYKDLLTGPIIQRLCESGLHSSVQLLLSALPLAKASWEEGEIVDFAGTQVDATDGIAVLNAPDERGDMASLRRGTRLELTWYRRTDAGLGNLAAESIALVEQPPNISPRLLGVQQPLATLHGSDRESEKAAIQRVFGPATPLPVTPGDWERLVRQDLGPRASGWSLRVWSYSERALMASAVWPPETVEEVESSAVLTDALVTAGPETLLIAIEAHGQDLAWATTVIDGLVARWRDRIPTIERALVTPLWPLTIETEDAITVPAHNVHRLLGTLSDAEGRVAPVPKVTLLLNAVITEVIGA